MNQPRTRSASLLGFVALACVIFCLLEQNNELGPIGEEMLHEHNGLLFNTEAADADEAIDDGSDNNEEIDQLMYGRRALRSQEQYPGVDQSMMTPEEMEDPAGYEAGRRALLTTIQDASLGGDDYDAAFAAVRSSEPQSKYTPLPSIQPYTITDAISESSLFETTFAVLVYNPIDDNFVGLYNKSAQWAASNKKLFVTMNNLAFLLRKLFPERFTKESPEFAMAIGSGDYPHVKLNRIPHTSGTAPVFEFGSAFRDTSLYPNMIPMSMPERHHLLCYEEWVQMGTVCKKLKAAERGGNGELVFGEEKGLKWDDLIVSLHTRHKCFAYNMFISFTSDT